MFYVLCHVSAKILILILSKLSKILQVYVDSMTVLRVYLRRQSALS